MEFWRDCDDHRVDRRIVDRRRIARIGAGAAVLAAERVGLRAIAARVAAGDLTPEGFQMPAVDARDESAAKKGDT
jgi:hypothetical protein